jgi:hypothetical protein
VKRFIPYVVPTLTVASLLVFVAMLAMWTRSHLIPFGDGLAIGWRPRTEVRPYVCGGIGVISYDGGLDITRNRLVLTQERDIAPYLKQAERGMSYMRMGGVGPHARFSQTLKFDWKAPHVTRASRPPQKVAWQWQFRLPYWFISLPPAILPALWVNRRRKLRRERRRAASGLCLNCGYDMRTTPERCPECGSLSA